MSTVFVDTSALIMLLQPGDRGHAHAVECFERLRHGRAVLITTSYVLIETYALLQRRAGLGAVAALRSRFAPLLRCVWVNALQHEAGLDLLQQRGRRQLSLVDAVSFVVMREHRIDEAFAFDEDFAIEGFAVLSP